MQRYSTHGTLFKEGGGWLVAEKRDVYLASEVDALVADLKNALREAMGWNWLDEDNPPPKDVVDQCNRALMER